MARYSLFSLIPVEGTVERSLFDLLLLGSSEGVPVACLAEELGVDAEAVLRAFNNLRLGMFEAENDYELSYDA
jgi:hypothetical protein